VTLFVVDRGAKGLEAAPVRLVDASLASRLRFEGVEVDADAVLGEVDGGRAPLARVLNAVRVGSASELIGVGAGAMALTVDYLKTRKQFGLKARVAPVSEMGGNGPSTNGQSVSLT